MTKANSTDITAVLDRSGSMSIIARDMMGGFDTFIAEQSKVAGECRVTLVQFDDEFETVYTARPIADVPPLLLVPRGSTALLDAVGKTIVATGERLRAMREQDRPEKVLFVIITDGHENASREYNHPHVAAMTKRQREVYNWEFMYFGANQDALEVAKDMGILRNAVTYEQKTSGARAMFATASVGASLFRSHTYDTGSNVPLVDQAIYAANVVATPEPPETTEPPKSA